MTTENIKRILKLKAEIETLSKEAGFVTKNLTGEGAEHLVINLFNESSDLPNLKLADTNQKGFDAISTEGERVQIKATRSNNTGDFKGMGKEQKFDSLVIVKLNEDLTVNKMIKLDWITFLKFKKIRKSEPTTWIISITQELIKESQI